MTPNQYQELASRTLIDKPRKPLTDFEYFLLWNLTGLSGESGELLEYAKKGIFHEQGIDVEKIKNELGDVLWYLSATATKCGLTLEEIMEHNIEKLKARYPEGWNPQDSTNRGGMAK